jgi:hypothetical protein
LGVTSAARDINALVSFTVLSYQGEVRTHINLRDALTGDASIFVGGISVRTIQRTGHSATNGDRTLFLARTTGGESIAGVWASIAIVIDGRVQGQ